MSKLLNSTKSSSLSKLKANSINNTSMSSKKMNQSRVSGKSETKMSKTIKDSLNNTDLKLQFVSTQKKENNEFLKSNVDESLRCLVCKDLFKEPVCCYK